MAASSGIAGQIGYVAESTWGVPVTVTRFLPLISESLKQEVGRLDAKGIIAGRNVADADAWGAGMVSVAGSVQHELYDHSMGVLFKNALGANTTAGSGPYTHTMTPADQFGQSLTVQVGRPDLAGTVRPATYAGMKINKWEIAGKAGEIATVGLDFVGKYEAAYRTVTDGVTTNTSTSITSATAAFGAGDVGRPISGTGIPANTTIAAVTSATAATLSAAATATGTNITFTIGVALASASFASSLNPVRMVDTGCSLTNGGTSVPIKSFKISGDNKLQTRPLVGSPFTAEPIANDLRDYMVEFTAEFTNRTLLDQYVNSTTSAVVLTLAAGSKTYVFTTNVRLDDGTTALGGRDMLEVSAKAKCIGSTDAAAITLVATNSDSTI